MRRIFIGSAIAVPVLVAVIALVGWFVYDERVNEDEVGRNVSAAGIDLSGMTSEEVAAAAW